MDGQRFREGLVLTRKAGEAVVVKAPDGSVLRVVIDSVKGSRVRVRLVDVPKGHFDISRPEQKGKSGDE